VAQFTFALLLEICHHVGDHHYSVQRGDWQRSRDWSYWLSPHVELAGKTIGIVGMGRVGKRVSEIAHAFGMRIIASSRTGKSRSPIEYPSVSFVTPPELFSQADVITPHCPQTEETAGMVNKVLLAHCKPDAFLINTARGGLVMEADLAECLNQGRLGGAALDGVTVEPIRSDNPLLKAKDCIITPHNAWAGLAARRRLMTTTTQNVAAFLGGHPCHVVNR